MGRIPIDPAVGEACDAGTPFVYHYNRTETAKAFEQVAGPIFALMKTTATEPVGNQNKPKGQTTMTIAIPLTDGKLSAHFGHCEAFALVDVDETTQTILGRQTLVPPAHEPGVLPRWLHERGAAVIIAGGMGQRAQSLFAENGIQVVVGASGQEPEKIAKHYLEGTLACGINVCDH